MQTWIDIPNDSDFTIYNIPFGIAIVDNIHEVVTRVGDEIIRLSSLYDENVFAGINLKKEVLTNKVLNDFIELGKPVTSAVRNAIIDFCTGEAKQTNSLVALKDARMSMPLFVQDYTDFYSSKEHAMNLGIMFRGPENALMPNWLHLPVGYHGRASSIIISGNEIKRPNGQIKPVDGLPVYSPTKRMDFELELGFVVGKATDLGSPIPIENAFDHIFGLTLFNDWSARDIQKWEYVPLGPFLGKNFASTISPWIVTMDALEPFKVPCPKQEPEVLDYLKFDGASNYDINLYVDIITPNGDINTVSHSNFKFMYWNMCQQLAHHTVNGCNINVGDIYASGTISGQDQNSYGSMLEISKSGKEPLTMKDGSTRAFIQNGDTVRLRGKCEKDGISLGFGICEGTIVE